MPPARPWLSDATGDVSMSENSKAAQRLMELGGYRRKIIAFKLCDEVPSGVESYGDDISFYCAIAAEIWQGRQPFYVTSKNVLCGGAVHSGMGSRRIIKEEFDAGLSQSLGKNKAYASREVFRRVNQQMPHHFKQYRYQVIGALEDMDDYDVLMVVAEAEKIMQLCKVYTWKTGELIHGVTGSAWCSNSFPFVHSYRTMTFNMGDPPSRRLMGLGPGEMYCFIHSSLLELIVENYKNISSGEVA
ncbi:MAG: DUF169 domain-containing protein [Deltaproteobacteria bacterium]|nr:DUF169 domain-containing protein [Deltaproteobacteria bacterium]